VPPPQGAADAIATRVHPLVNNREVSGLAGATPLCYETDTFHVSHTISQFVSLKDSGYDQLVLANPIHPDFVEIARFATESDFVKVHHDKMCVIGHIPVTDVLIDRENNLTLIDTGCVFGNKLSAICMETQEVFSVGNPINYARQFNRVISLKEKYNHINWSATIEKTNPETMEHYNSQRLCCLITAYKSSKSESPEDIMEQNRANDDRQEQLEEDLKDCGYGYVKLIGDWKNQETGNVEEGALLVVANTAGSDNEFRNIMLTLKNRNDQDAIILKDNDKDVLYRCDGYEGSSNYTGDFRTGIKPDGFSVIKKQLAFQFKKMVKNTVHSDIFSMPSRLLRAKQDSNYCRSRIMEQGYWNWYTARRREAKSKWRLVHEAEQFRFTKYGTAYPHEIECGRIEWSTVPLFAMSAYPSYMRSIPRLAGGGRLNREQLKLLGINFNIYP